MAAPQHALLAGGRPNEGQAEPRLSDEEQKEREHFQKVIDAFRYYRIHSLKRVAVSEKYYHELPQRHQRLIPNFLDHLSRLQTCIDHNFSILRQIIRNTDHMFENSNFGPDAQSTINEIPNVRPREFDMDKVKTTLKQIVRDWSDAGKAERDACYLPVIREIQSLFPEELCVPSSVHILVPGAGLGRLAHDVAKLGYTCQGNEWSLYMLFASNFVLNKCTQVNQYTLYPWVHQFCNNWSSKSQIEPVQFPDRPPTDMPPSANFSMAAGDFLEVYTEPECWDCVATVFFIDTAHNVLSYIETIFKILRSGGYWINLGPLLYHFADMANESSIELSYEDLREVIVKVGFEILRERVSVPTTYTENPRSMLKYQYDSAFFVARKPLRR